MIQPNQVKFKAEETEKNIGIFSIGPLPRGYGQTLGNSLRRVLLSSLSGAALSQVTFKGISHPFSSIEGVKEDGVKLTLNLKRVRLKMHTDNPVVLELAAKGKGEVKAGDIKAPSEVEIVNEDLVIAHLSDKSSSLNAEIIAEKGVGYQLAAERETKKLGSIALDCDFSPVVNVSYHVDNTRYLEETDLDELVIEITTDGTISPKEALVGSSEILGGFFDRLATGQEEVDGVGEEDVEGSEESAEVSKAKNIPLEETALSVRVVNSLKKAGINNLGDVLETGKAGLGEVKNIGGKSLDQVEEALEKEDLSF